MLDHPGIRQRPVQAGGQRLDRVSFNDRKPGRAWNRIHMVVEARILSVRQTLREDSVLGEYGPDAIGPNLPCR